MGATHEKFLQALRDFTHAAENLTENFNNELGAIPEYPFDTSFDEVYHDLVTYQHAVEEAARNFRARTLPKSAAELASSFEWYSSNRYISGANVVNMLRRKGYDDREVQAIMQSKWTRWAADAGTSQHRMMANANDLARWMADPRNRETKEAVAELVRQTFD